MAEEITLTQTYLIRGMHSLKSRSQGMEPLHGHHYQLEVCLRGDIDQESGMLISRDDMNEIVKEYLIKKVDKKNFDQVFEFSSGEYLSREFFKILKGSPLGDRLHCISLQETQKNRFTCYG